MIWGPKVPRYRPHPVLLGLVILPSIVILVRCVALTEARKTGRKGHRGHIGAPFDPDLIVASSFTSPLYENPFPRVAADEAKQESVKGAFVHAYHSYERFCFGRDELAPVTKKCKDFIHSGLTIIDSLTTLIIMNLTNEYQRARDFVENSFMPSGTWSVFEFVIRCLGGLLSAGELTGDKLFLDTAIAVGLAMLPLFEAKGGFFNSRFKIVTDAPRHFRVTAGVGDWCLAEVGTFQLEFLTLAKLTGDRRFVTTAMNVYRRIWGNFLNNGLVSRHIGTGRDSYYEYIIKSYLLTGGVSDRLLDRHLMIVRDIKSKLMFKTLREKLIGIGELTDHGLDPEMEHLATFAGGLFAVGSVTGNPHALEDLGIADELARTYSTVYRGFQSGVMPERVRYNLDDPAAERDFRTGHDRSYILRPESVESVYVMWKFTGLQKYRDYAWEMFKGINRSCRVAGGFAPIADADAERPEHVDEMESFFLAETLKYLYLTFSDSNVLSPAEWVFNTEAHPLRVWDPETIRKFKGLISLDTLDNEPLPKRQGRTNPQDML
jgi:mannosyl-oligosaccharide alpha-1,2-mannosidase